MIAQVSTGAADTGMQGVSIIAMMPTHYVKTDQGGSQVHSRLPARITASLAVLVLLAALAAVALTASPANAFPDKQADCSACHGSGYSGTATATPSAGYPAAGAGYTVAITVSQNTAGVAGYWIANSTAARRDRHDHRYLWRRGRPQRLDGERHGSGL